MYFIRIKINESFGTIGRGCERKNFLEIAIWTKALARVRRKVPILHKSIAEHYEDFFPFVEPLSIPRTVVDWIRSAFFIL